MSDPKLSEQWYAEADKFAGLTDTATCEENSAFMSGMSNGIRGCAIEVETLEEAIDIADRAISILANCGGMLNCGKHCPVAGECEPLKNNWTWVPGGNADDACTNARRKYAIEMAKNKPSEDLSAPNRKHG